MNVKSLLAYLPLVVGLVIELAFAQSLKVATMNIWSGLDYNGVLSIGEYESVETREKRLGMLIHELKELQADVIALQEVNPVNCISFQLADSLGYDVIYERANGGIKIGSVGIPWNLNEGLAILAKKQLRLQLADVWPLSASFGAFGDGLSFHFAEQNIALVGKIHLEHTSFYIVNVHLAANLRADSSTIEKMKEIALDKSQPVSRELQALSANSDLRFHQTKNLVNRISSNLLNVPVVLLGDFNASPHDAEIHYLTTEANFWDAMGALGPTDRMTWDPQHNTNIAYSTSPKDSRGEPRQPTELLEAWHDGFPARIDYVLLDTNFKKEDIKKSTVFSDQAQNELFASDHYGVIVEIDCSRLTAASTDKNEYLSAAKSSVEPLPILSYDTDVGLGFGAKAFFLNQSGMAESFDVVLFNSTKGERWYRFVFSVPDFEIRQGNAYPLGFDLLIDYDKWIKNSFFGIGNDSKFIDREIYTREPLEIAATFSHGFTEHSVGQAGMRFKTVRNYNFEPEAALRDLPPSLNSAKASSLSLFSAFRQDTRDSYINASRGLVLQGELEYAPQTTLTTTRFVKVSAWLQTYSVLMYPKTVLAIRTGVQALVGNDIPVQFLNPIGGNQTLRGSPQDRFLDKTSAIVNLELRFPLFWRFGGLLGYDTGRVWNSFGKIGLSEWAENPTVGLRFYMDTFVVRMDLGFGSETTGFYLNFGQLF